MDIEQNPVVLAVKKFEAVQTKFSDEGACDSEPSWVFKDLMRKAIKNGGEFVPVSKRGWQLYSGGKEATAAAQLNTAAKRVHNLIQKQSHVAVKQASKWYGWDDDWS